MVAITITHFVSSRNAFRVDVRAHWAAYNGQSRTYVELSSGAIKVQAPEREQEAFNWMVVGADCDTKSKIDCVRAALYSAIYYSIQEMPYNTPAFFGAP